MHAVFSMAAFMSSSLFKECGYVSDESYPLEAVC